MRCAPGERDSDLSSICYAATAPRVVVLVCLCPLWLPARAHVQDTAKAACRQPRCRAPAVLLHLDGEMMTQGVCSCVCFRGGGVQGPILCVCYVLVCCRPAGGHDGDSGSIALAFLSRDAPTALSAVCGCLLCDDVAAAVKVCGGMCNTKEWKL